MAEKKWVAEDRDFDAMRCPECGSFDVRYIFGESEDGRTLDEFFECPDCGCKYTVTSRPVEVTITRRRRGMTWLDLIDLLRKQPREQLEKEVFVAYEGENADCDFTPHRVIDLTCPTNEDPAEWERNPEFYMTLCITKED